MNVHKPKDLYVTMKSLAAYLTLQDLCFLLALRREGYGAGRLRRVMKSGRDIYKEFRDRYCVENDIKNLNEEAPHILAMKEELKNGGYDYDDEQRKLDVSKYRFHGNQVTL